MARPNKANTVAELADHFRTSNAAVLTEYRGLTVAQLKTLRRSLGSTVTYAVVKNTLTKIAARDAGVTGVEDLLAGPSAIAFVKGDAVEAAKAIRDFSKENPALVIKGGVMDGKALSAADVQKIADLESREVLLSKLAGAMKAKQSQAAALFSAPLSKAVRTFAALSDKLPEGEAPAAAATEEAAPATAADEAVPATAADEAAEATVETPETAAEATAEATVEDTTEG